LCPVHGQFIKTSSHPFERIIRGRPIHKRVGYDCVQKKSPPLLERWRRATVRCCDQSLLLLIESATAHLTIKGSSSSSELVPHIIQNSYPSRLWRLICQPREERRIVARRRLKPLSQHSTELRARHGFADCKKQNTFDLPLKISFGKHLLFARLLSFRLRAFVCLFFLCRIFPSRHLDTACHQTTVACAICREDARTGVGRGRPLGPPQGIPGGTTYL